MPIAFPCPECSGQIKVSRKHAGRKGKCQHCGGVIRVPRIPGTESGSQELPAFQLFESQDDSGGKPVAAQPDPPSPPQDTGTNIQITVLRCPYCHADIQQQDEKKGCQNCTAWSHSACWREFKGCASCNKKDEKKRPPTKVLVAAYAVVIFAIAFVGAMKAMEQEEAETRPKPSSPKTQTQPPRAGKEVATRGKPISPEEQRPAPSKEDSPIEPEEDDGEEDRRWDLLDAEVTRMAKAAPNASLQQLQGYLTRLAEIDTHEVADARLKIHTEQTREKIRARLAQPLIDRASALLAAGAPDQALKVAKEADRILDGDVSERLEEVLEAARSAIEKRRKTNQARKRNLLKKNLSERANAAVWASRKQACNVGPAITAALKWLLNHQSPDGSWDCDGWTKNCVRTSCRGPGANLGRGSYDVGVSALALLALIRAGTTTEVGASTKEVDRGLRWMLKQQASDGAFGYSSGHGETIYNHAIATIAICDAYSRTKALFLKRPAEKAVDYVLKSRNPDFGWKYGPRTGKNDSSVTGWMVGALAAAKRAGIPVPDSAYAGAERWFDRSTDHVGRCGYESPGGGSAVLKGNESKYADDLPCMTAVAVKSRLLMGEKVTNVAVDKGAGILMKYLPTWPKGARWGDGIKYCNMYYWYYGTSAMRRFRGTKRDQWGLALRAALLPNQRMGGCEDGSWDPLGEWCLAGGRVYATAINALTLAIGSRTKKRSVNSKTKGLFVVSKSGGVRGQGYFVRGVVKNEGAKATRRMRILIRLRLKSGQVIVKLRPKCPKRLKPGKSFSFRATYKGSAGPLVHSFDVLVEDSTKAKKRKKQKK